MAARKIRRSLRPRRPVDTKWPVSNPFGVKGDYSAGYHTGIDYAVPVGTPVHTPRAGRVIYSGYDAAAYGNYIMVKSWSGQKVYLFAHLSTRLVRTGAFVRRGKVVGRSGNTGNSTGPHLHVEQRHPPFGYADHERPDW